MTKQQTRTLAVILSILAVAVISYAIYRTTSSPRTPTNTSSTDQSVPPTTDEPRMDAPLYFTTMTHMEGNFKDDLLRPLFERHVEDIRASMELFDEVGAKLTIESEQSFAKANTNWGVNILKEVVDAGHGVGTHADFGGGTGETYTLPEYIAKFEENKALVDALVGAENNQGVSGGFGAGEWVKAAAGAGFKYLDGLTALGYLSMPLSARPDGYSDQYIRREAFHDSIPPEFSDRLYLYDLKDARDLVPDEDGVLTIMGGEIGELASLAEGRSNCFPDCTFDEDDIAAVVEAVKEADRIRDRSRVARLNIHIPAILLDEDDRVMMQKFLAALKPYADDGTIVFATQLEAYQGYVNFQSAK